MWFYHAFESSTVMYMYIFVLWGSMPPMCGCLWRTKIVTAVTLKPVKYLPASCLTWDSGVLEEKLVFSWLNGNFRSNMKHYKF